MTAGPADTVGGQRGGDAPATRDEAEAQLRRARRIFIAYSHSDMRSARAFRKAILRLRGQSDASAVFLDQESLAPGSSVSPDDIDQRLKAADLFVVLCGRDTAEREQVNREIAEAMRLRDDGSLMVLPVILGSRVRLPPALDFRVQGIFLGTLFPDVIRRRRIRRGAFALLIVLLLTAGWAAFRYRTQGQSNARQARVQRLAAEAREAMPADPARAVLLASEAMQASRPDDGAVGSARQTLRDAIDAAPGYGIGRHDGAVLGLAFALAGSRVVSASADGTVRVWEATTDPARPPLVLRGHKGSVAHLAVDRKGEHLVTGGDDGTVAVWNLTDPDTQASHLALEPPQSGEPKPIAGVDISPDGRLVIAATGTYAWIWRLGDGPPGEPIELSHGMEVKWLSFSPDGRFAATFDCSAHLWRLDAPRIAASERDLGAPMTCVKSATFSGDGHRLVTGSQDNRARLWDLTRANPAASPVSFNGLVAGLDSFAGIDLVAVLPDGAILTGYGDGSTQLWEWNGKTKLEPGPVLKGHERRVAHVTTDAERKWLATLGEDGVVKFWDLDSESPDSTGWPLRGQVGITALAMNGVWIATGAADGTVRLHRSLMRDPNHVLYAESGIPTDVSADSRWVATGADGDVWLWDLSQDEPVETPLLLRGHSKSLSRLIISPDGRWLATGSYDRTAKLWDLRSTDIAASAQPLPRGDDVITNMVFSGDSRRLLIGGENGTALVWDMAATPLGPPRVLTQGDSGRVSVDASRDGRWLVTGGDRGPVRLWRVTGDGIGASAPLGRDGDLIWPLMITPDGRWLLTGSDRCQAQLWNLGVADIARSEVELEACAGESFALDVTEDGHWLATGGEDGVVRLFDLTRQNPADGVRLLSGHSAAISRIVAAPGSRVLVTGDASGVIRMWDLTARDIAASAIVLGAHQERVTAINVTRDRRWLVTADATGAVHLWDLAAADVATSVGTLPGHGTTVTGLATTADSQWVVSLANDGSVQLSNLSVDWLLRRARRAAGRNLTRDEWTRYLPGEPYRATFSGLGE